MWKPWKNSRQCSRKSRFRMLGMTISIKLGSALSRLAADASKLRFLKQCDRLKDDVVGFQPHSASRASTALALPKNASASSWISICVASSRFFRASGIPGPVVPGKLLTPELGSAARFLRSTWGKLVSSTALELPKTWHLGVTRATKSRPAKVMHTIAKASSKLDLHMGLKCWSHLKSIKWPVISHCNTST